MQKTQIAEYLSHLTRNLARGRATEHTHRSALERLIEQIDNSVDALNEPKRIECGAPDLEVVRDSGGINLVVGYIEAKDVGIRLDAIQDSEQVVRYRSALENLILTDYLDFRWFVRGNLRQHVVLATWNNKSGVVPRVDGEKDLAALLGAFLQHSPAAVTDSEELAIRLAWLTHLIRDVVLSSLKRGKASRTIEDLKTALMEILLPRLTAEQFADMFSQTLAYGLFAARVHHDGKSLPFTRSNAKSEIPKTNPFLRKLFDTITGVEIEEEPFAGLVDDLVQLLRLSDMPKILEGFGRRKLGDDPVVHFYETFLAAYDPELRERRGVYYTPAPVH